MTEIEQIKDVLVSHLRAYTEGDNDKADRLDKLIEEKSIDWLFSLITTIESQKEEIELKESEYQATINKLNRLTQTINSHDPEGRNYTNQQYVDLLQKFESLKAITELQERQIKELTISLKQESYADENPQYSDYIVKCALDRALKNE